MESLSGIAYQFAFCPRGGTDLRRLFAIGFADFDAAACQARHCIFAAMQFGDQSLTVGVGERESTISGGVARSG